VRGEQTGRVPAQPPLHRTNRQPLAGTARSVKARPALKIREQTGVQLTVPFPVVATLTGMVTGPNTAITAFAESMSSRQEAMPEHAPLQPTKRDFAAGLGSSVGVSP